MSPEQCRGAGQVDQRTDIYSLGCLLFVLLTGRPPFWAEGSGELIAMHLREAPPHASQFNVRVPPAVDALIARCLAKDPAARYLNGIELANAASEVLSGLSAELPRATTPAPAPARVVGTAATTLSSSTGMVAAAPTAASDARPHRPRGLMIAGGLGFVCIIGLVFVIVARPDPPAGSPGPRERATSTPSVAGSAAGSAPGSATTVPLAGSAAPVIPTTASDPRGEIATRMLQVINGFLRWSATHAGSPCPTPKDLAPQKLDDPWGHAMRLTCVDQPANHMIGIVSSGPDGVAGNRDDIASWTLPGDVTDAIAGPRWTARRATATTGIPTTRGSGAKTGTPSTTGSTAAPATTDLDGDGIPDVRSK
jgi:hypothetical protein